MISRDRSSSSRRALLFLGAALLLAGSGPAYAAAAHTAGVAGDHFVVDGKPLQIISGEMHYPRVPRADWADRLSKMKAMGLNSVTAYVFWNAHEATPGHYDFSGQNDIAAFVREAQRAGLYVLLRPGPYVCAEWELGGYPAWLLKDRSLVLRSRDAKLTAATDAWFAQLGKQLQPLLLQDGGPILATQVENEYGSFGDDHAYVELIRSLLVKNGLAAPILYTADGASAVPRGSLPDLPAVINFGTGDAKAEFAKFATLRPTGPRMSGEYWAGWFDHWGDKHQTRSGKEEADELAWMLAQGYSVSLYMASGGTSFGWMNGANSDGRNYEPDTTSYDYDAPISENGDLNPKYQLFQDVIAHATGAKLPHPPATAGRRVFPVGPSIESASLWENLPAPVTSAKLLTMEDLDQNYGYILYETQLPAGSGGALKLEGLHDYAQVYLDHALAGTLDRRLKQDTLTLPGGAGGARTLSILVENTGRVNYTDVIRTERKGLTGSATLAGKPLGAWKIYSLPFAGSTDPASFHYKAGPCSGPCLFRAGVAVDTPADTYLDLSGNAKGFVWLNEHPLGRLWSVGPQYSLWTPASWLHAGENRVILLDLKADGKPHLATAQNWVASPSVPSPADAGSSPGGR